MSMSPEPNLEELSKSIAVENTIDKHDSETSPSESTSELVEQEKDCESTPHSSDDHNDDDDDDFQPRGPANRGIVQVNDTAKEKERKKEAKKEEAKRRDEAKRKREAEKRANTKS